VPEARERTAPARREGDRAADVAAIDALIDRLVPALTAKLSSTHLGELEVRGGEWRIRLRRPAGSGAWNGELRRASDHAARGHPGHDSHGLARSAVEGHRPVAPASTNGTGQAGASQGAGAAGSRPARSMPDDETRRVVTSPAVGVFRPGPRAAVGTRVRDGDALGHVDVLGVAEDVLAPTDGVVGELLVDGGTAVEYGQELIVVAVAMPAEAAH
jgi:acetyl-CoA carboxylase biotin carboxyl carrier protein